MQVITNNLHNDNIYKKKVKMKIRKSQLLKILKEEFDMDEMAAPKHPLSRNIEFGGKTVGHRLKAGEKSDVSQKGAPLPAYVVVYTCGEEVTNFIQTHQDLIDHVKKTYMNPESTQFKDIDYQHPEIIFTNAKECPAARPYQQQKHYFDAQGNEIQPNIPVIPYEKSGKRYSLKEAINRVLKVTLFGTKDSKTGQVIDPGLMNDADLNQHLEDCSIPSFKVRERSYEDRHDVKNTNQRIHYGSDAFILYESANDFLGDVLNRTVGIDSDINRRETHLARLRNNIYRHWDSKKKNEKKFEGLTDVYKLEKLGYTEKNYDVNIYAKFDLLGQASGENRFTWRLKLDVYYGKKVTVEDMIERKNVKLFKSLDEVKVVEYEGNVEHLNFDDEVDVNNHILAKPEVLNGLKEAISEFKEKIMEISSEDALEMANYFQYEIGDEFADELDESLDRMIKNILKESGMKKTIKVKESQLVKIIAENVVKGLSEQEKFDDFITKTKENNEKDNQTPEQDGQESPEAIKLTIGKDENGNFYIIKDADTENAKIVAKA